MIFGMSFDGLMTSARKRNGSKKSQSLGSEIMCHPTLKFSYIVYYSRSTSDNFGNYYTHFQLEFFDGFYIFGILAYNIHNKILNLEQSAHFYFSPTPALLGCKRCKKPKLRINQTTPKLKSYYKYDIQGFQKCKNHQKILTRSGCNSFENYLTCIYYSDLCSKTLGA